MGNNNICIDILIFIEKEILKKNRLIYKETERFVKSDQEVADQ